MVRAQTIFCYLHFFKENKINTHNNKQYGAADTDDAFKFQ